MITLPSLTLYEAMYSHQPYPYDFLALNPVQSYIDNEFSKVPRAITEEDAYGRLVESDPIDVMQ